MCVYLIPSTIKFLINYVRIRLATNSEQRSTTEISDRPTMPPDNPNMGIVSLSWYYIIGKVIAECARKIEQIGNDSGDWQHERQGYFGSVDRRR